MHERDDDDDLFGLDTGGEPVKTPDEPAFPGRPRRVVAAGIAAAAVVALVGLLLAAGSGSSSPAGARSTAVTTSATAPRTTTTSPAPATAPTPTPTPTVPADVPAAERAELAGTAALLDSPVTLTSPAGGTGGCPRASRIPAPAPRRTSRPARGWPPGSATRSACG